MLLNLYQQEAANRHLLPVYKEQLMQKATMLGLFRDSTRARLSFSGEKDLRDFEEYKELTEEEIVEMARDNTYNQGEEELDRMWGSFDNEKYGDWEHGYIYTPNSFYVNKYLRAKYTVEQAKETRDYQKQRVEEIKESLKGAETEQEKEKLTKQLEEATNEYEKAAARTKALLKTEMLSFEQTLRNRMNVKSRTEADNKVNTWIHRTEKLIKDLDRATQMNRLPHKARFYRMVDSSILEWGLGLSHEELKMPMADLTELINRRTGTGFVDRGAMSTAWCVDQEFSDRPIMLTLLTDAGKRCFVTRNFKEGEVIFGRNTRYMLVSAINHGEDNLTLRRSVDVRDTTDDPEDLRSSKTTTFRGIELIMKVVSDDAALKEQVGEE